MSNGSSPDAFIVNLTACPDCGAVYQSGWYHECKAPHNFNGMTIAKTSGTGTTENAVADMGKQLIESPSRGAVFGPFSYRFELPRRIGLLLIILALLPACAGPGAIRASEIRPLLLGQVEEAGILPRHDRYAEGDAAALRQSQAVRAELEEETTSAEELEAAGITPVLERHDAGVRQDRSAPVVLRRIWLQSSETMRRVLRASRGD